MLSKMMMTLCFFAFAGNAFAQTTRATAPKMKKRAPTTSSNVLVAKSDKNFNAADANLSSSNYAYQPANGRVAFTFSPSMETESSQINIKPLQQKSSEDRVTKLLTIRAQRGLANNWSWSAQSGFGTQESNSTGQKSSQNHGLADIVLGVQHLEMQGQNQWIYGSKMILGFSEKEDSYAYANGVNGDGNLVSGGSSLIPYLGLQVDKITHVMGAVASFEYAFEKSVSTKTRDRETVNVTQHTNHKLKIEGFIEKPLPQLTFGAKAGVTHYTDTDYNLRLGAERLNLGTNAYQVATAGAYARFKVSPRVDLLPSVDVARMIRNEGGSLTVDDVNSVNLGLTLRTAL